MIPTIQFNNKDYPIWQSQGFAAQWAFPFASQVCKGVGFDIGCNRKEWSLPGSITIDPVISKYDAYNLPETMQMMVNNELCYVSEVDFIFSSHCAEHLPDCVGALDYWATKIKQGGVLFLYLPNMDYQQYWQPQNNRKHLHYISPSIIRKYFMDRKTTWCHWFVTEGYDLNGSFYAIAEKMPPPQMQCFEQTQDNIDRTINTVVV